MTLKKQLGRSTAWMSAAATGNSIASFIIFIVLSRLLEPKDIGIVAFALIIVEVGKIIVNAGFPQAIVRHSIWDQTYSSTCFYLNLIFALGVTLVVIFLGSPLVAKYYEAEAVPILQVLSIIFFIEGVKAVHEGKLKREFAFKVIAIRSIVAGILSGIIGIYLAIKGYGVWALVAQQLINQCVITLFTLVSARWMPSFKFSTADSKHLLNFSTPLMVGQLITNVTSKIFEVLIGVVVGPAALGFYRVGGRVLFILQDIVLKPFEHTLLSALSRMDTLSAQADATLRVTRISAYLTFPIFFGAAAVGPEFIVFAFGEKWALSGEIMTILSLGMAPLVIGYQVNSALTASGNSKLVMSQSAWIFLINCVAGIIAVPYGLIIAAYAFSVRCYLTIFLNMYFFKKVFAVNIFNILKMVASPFIASLIMFTTIYFVKDVIPDTIPTAFRLIILCAIGGFIYTALMIGVFRSETRNFLIESAGIMPSKIRPAIAGLQKITRLL